MSTFYVQLLHSLLSLRLNTRQELSIIQNGVLIPKTERLMQALSGELLQTLFN
jgi:hypothetical protein